MQDADEECDDGVNSGEYGTCGTDCRFAPRCGDGILDDDWGSSATTVAPSGATAATRRANTHDPCGNGSVESGFGEECDDGENDGGYGECAPGCLIVTRCGDGVRQEPYEECDDGTNAGGYAACAAGCMLGRYCGDGIVQEPYEECDNGASGGGSCMANCRLYSD